MLAILITASVEATVITVLGPRLLEQEATSTPETNDKSLTHQPTDFCYIN
jgi:hypothetical protein